MLSSSFRKACRRLAESEQGFTLIELLVVITILGILAGVVIFAVSGLGDKGASTAIANDASTVRTAEESFCAVYTRYATMAELVAPPPRPDGQASGSFLTQPSALNGVVTDSSGNCGGTGYVLGSPQGGPPSTGATPFANANNTAPAFNFMQADFQSASGTSVSFSAPGNGASGGLKTQIDVATPPFALFASADLANVLGTITSGTATAIGTGTCTAANCPGIASTAQQYATGHLVIETCVQGGASLPPAPGNPNCAAPAGGYLATGTVTTVPQVVAALGSNSPAGYRLAIADPGAPNHTGATGGPSAPYGLAAYQALTSPGSGMIPGNATDTIANCSTGNAGGVSYQGCVNGGRIIFSANGATGLTGAQTALFTGQATTAFVALSQVKSPINNDTNAWYLVPDGLHAPVNQGMVLIDMRTGQQVPPSQQNGAAAAFEAYATSAKGLAVLQAFGYN